jgi:Putative beta-barrel porin 2
VFWSGNARGLVALVGPLLLVTQAHAQTGLSVQPVSNPDMARVQAGPLAIAPTISLTNFGVDNNVFNTGGTVEPTSDLTATIGPALDLWVRLPRLRFSGRTEFDYMYFRELTDLRSFNILAGGRVEVPLNRVTGWVDGALMDSNARQGYEIDAYAAHREDAGRIGVDLRLTARTTVGVYAGQSRIDYRADAFESQAPLAQARLALALNRTGTFQGVGVRYTATPLTTVGLFAEQQQDRFEFAIAKNADSFRVMPFVEFKPFALISGRASVGYRSVTFIQSGAPDFEGPVGQIDLSYTLLGRTILSVNARRDLDFSFYNDQNYLIGSIGGGVTHRLRGPLDLRGSVTGYRLTYRNRFLGQAALTLPGESGVSGRGEVGYQLQRSRGSRVSFYVEGSHRNSGVSVGRAYDRLRFGSNILYTF